MFSKKLIKYTEKLNSYNVQEKTGNIIRYSKASKIGERYFVSDTRMILETSQPIDNIEYKDKFNCIEVVDGCFNGIPSLSIKIEDIKTVPIGVSLQELKDGIKKVAGRKYGDRVLFRSSKDYPMLNARYLKDVMDVLNCKQMTYYNFNLPVYFFKDDNFQSNIRIVIFPVMYGGEFAGWHNMNGNTLGGFKYKIEEYKFVR